MGVGILPASLQSSRDNSHGTYPNASGRSPQLQLSLLPQWVKNANVNFCHMLNVNACETA